MEQGIIVFVDFDGVMHPAKGGGYFCRQAEFAKVLGELDDLAGAPAKVVVSSSWREGPILRLADGGFDREQAAVFLGVDPDRVLGAAPLIDHGRRDLEILAWLEGSGRASAPWLAIDDDPLLFPDDSVHSRTLFTDPSIGLEMEGFDSAARCLAARQLGWDVAEAELARIAGRMERGEWSSPQFKEASESLRVWVSEASLIRRKASARP